LQRSHSLRGSGRRRCGDGEPDARRHAEQLDSHVDTAELGDGDIDWNADGHER
jgi:hypothetical protein